MQKALFLVLVLLVLTQHNPIGAKANKKRMFYIPKQWLKALSRNSDVPITEKIAIDFLPSRIHDGS